MVPGQADVVDGYCWGRGRDLLSSLFDCPVWQCLLPSNRGESRVTLRDELDKLSVGWCEKHLLHFDYGFPFNGIMLQGRYCPLNLNRDEGDSEAGPIVAMLENRGCAINHFDI